MKTRLNIIIGVIFAVLLAGLLFIGSNPQRVRRMQSGFLGIISPFLRSGSNIERKVKDFRTGMATLDQLEALKIQLTEENKRLKAERKNTDDLQKIIDDLRQQMGFRKTFTSELVPARIVVRDASTWYNSVQIDRGSADGIQPDMAVITEAGLVGRTDVVSEHDCTVRLISDEQCKMAVKFETTGEQGIVRGARASSSLAPEISLRYLSKETAEKKQKTLEVLKKRQEELNLLDDEASETKAREANKEELNENEKAMLSKLRKLKDEVETLEKDLDLITSGVGGVFPRGLRVGRARDFKVLELDGAANVEPAVDLTTLEDVFVVKVTSEQPEPAREVAPPRVEPAGAVPPRVERAEPVRPPAGQPAGTRSGGELPGPRVVPLPR